MSSETTFHSTKEALSTLLYDIGDGKIQLPDFQRGWIWDDEHIKSLLVSVSLSYPVGSVMMLATGNSKVRFQPRPIEGVVGVRSEPTQLILDGQQRLTALFQTLFSKNAVKTQDFRGNEIKRWYYVDLRKLLIPEIDHEETIMAIPEDRMLRNFRREVVADYSTREKECANELFPLKLVFDFGRTAKLADAISTGRPITRFRTHGALESTPARFYSPDPAISGTTHPAWKQHAERGRLPGI